MATHTKEQWLAAKNANPELYAQFSVTDKQIAEENPDFGMGLMQYKSDWAKATTDEAKYLANEGANQLRSAYGYSGGTSGGGFYPSVYTAGQPQYTNNYSDETKKLLDAVLNREEFTYDKESDPNYIAMRDSYIREGNRAMEDTLGEVASRTGGMASSYATSAAADANNRYMQEMSDKAQQLYEAAYNRYLNEYNMDVNKLNTVQQQEQNEYTKYLNQLSQYNTDRTFAQTAEANTKTEAANAKTEAQNTVAQKIYLGLTPTDEEIAAAGYDTETVQAMITKQKSSDSLTNLQNYINAGGIPTKDMLINSFGLTDEQADEYLTNITATATTDGGSEGDGTDSGNFIGDLSEYGTGRFVTKLYNSGFSTREDGKIIYEPFMKAANENEGSLYIAELKTMLLLDVAKILDGNDAEAVNEYGSIENAVASAFSDAQTLLGLNIMHIADVKEVLKTLGWAENAENTVVDGE